MDFEFIGTALIFLTPITLASIVFGLASLSSYGYPMASFDVVLVHYHANIETYAPLVPTFNTIAKTIFGNELYPYWFLIFVMIVSFYIPYILLFEITKQHRYPIFFIYGTAIPTINLLVGLIPTSIITCLILLMIARPKLFIPILITSALTHSFGVIFILLTKAWLMIDDYTKNCF